MQKQHTKVKFLKIYILQGKCFQRHHGFHYQLDPSFAYFSVVTRIKHFIPWVLRFLIEV